MLPNTELVEIEGTWTLFYQGREYIRLLDARSRADAEAQITEMLLIKLGQCAPQRKLQSTKRHLQDTKTQPSSLF